MTEACPSENRYPKTATNASDRAPLNSAKIEIGYRDIAVVNPLWGEYGKIRHVGIRISGTTKYDGDWGFGPASRFEGFEVLRGQTVKGKVFEDDGPYSGLQVKSTDPDYIKAVYNNIQRSIIMPPNYNLYGFGDADNCYEWRDQMLNEKKHKRYDF